MGEIKRGEEEETWGEKPKSWRTGRLPVGWHWMKEKKGKERGECKTGGEVLTGEGKPSRKDRTRVGKKLLLLTIKQELMGDKGCVDTKRYKKCRICGGGKPLNTADQRGPLRE